MKRCPHRHALCSLTSPMSRKIRSLSQRMRKISLENVLDLLSEFLAREEGEVSLYLLARDRAENAQLREAIELHLHTTEHHVDLLQTAIRDLGGNPQYVSPLAE